ncbi:MAG: ABC transporter ATP-binding protein [Nostoc sp.]|uniref:ABC transporter ATP-binding protein n=1 Tax=Nostoc sp. TaxID=1180 RepID=UPI002FF9A245
MIKYLFLIAGKRKQQFIQGTVLYVIASLFAAIPYVFLYLILKELFEQSLNLEKIIIFTILIASCLFLQGITLYWANSINYPTSYRLIGDLRLCLGNHIRQLPMGFFVQRQIGDINAIVNQDMQNIESIPSKVYPKIVSAIAVPTFIATFLFFINWRMALATLPGLPLALSIFTNSQKLMKKLTNDQKRAQVEANSRIIEYIQGLGIIKAFNQTGTRFSKLQEALNDYKQTNLALVGKLIIPTVAFAGSLDLGFVIILSVGIYGLLGGQLNVPTFLLFLVLGLRFYAPIYELLELSAIMRLMDAALERVKNVLNTKLLPQSHQEKQISQFDIEFRNVCFSYEQKPVLQNVSFKIPEKTITALVGPSGAGKTTIANLISRFWDVDNGEVLLGGVNIKDLQTDQLLSYISMVFQDVYLFNNTIANNINIGNKNATLEEIITAAKAAQCHDFIEQLPNAYDTYLGEGGATLSVGQKQRIAIARAFLKNAPIVILDEATASVDPENQILIQQAIDSLVASKTLVIIAHQLSTIISADQILVLDQCQLIEQGQHNQLLALGGLYYRFWQKQQKTSSWKLNRSDF